MKIEDSKQRKFLEEILYLIWPYKWLIIKFVLILSLVILLAVSCSGITDWKNTNLSGKYVLSEYMHGNLKHSYSALISPGNEKDNDYVLTIYKNGKSGKYSFSKSFWENELSFESRVFDESKVELSGKIINIILSKGRIVWKLRMTEETVLI